MRSGGIFTGPLKRFSFLLAALFLPGAAEKVGAQNLNDTLRLPEFEIRSNIVVDNQGFKRIKIDSSVLVPQVNANLSVLLSQHSSIFIKSYGNGSLASSSFRGMAAQHTQVEWNGINLSSPMLGQVDFSQIRISQFDALEIYYGAAGISKTAGAFGGVVDLVTNPDWNNRFSLTAAQTMASFDTWASNVNVAAGNDKMQSHTKFNYGSSLNDFQFTSDSGKVIRQKNASFRHYDFSQEFFCRLHDHHLLSAKVWYSDDDRHLPKPLSALGANPEQQYDHALRAILEYKFVEKNFNLMVRSAMVDQYMHYIEEGMVNDSYRCYSSVNRIRLNYTGIKNLTLKPGIDFTYDWALADAYGGRKTRSTASLFADIAYIFGKKLSSSLVIRQDLVNGKFIPIVPALGIEFQPSGKINLSITANLSRNCRYPTMNDLYWERYGNPDLKTETNYSAESGIAWNSGKMIRNLFLEASISGYYSRIYDMITWLPDTVSSLYRPLNVPGVKARGIEMGLNVSWEILRFNLGMVASYNLCHSTYEKVITAVDSSKIGKQLLYIPVHTLNTTVSVKRWNFYCLYNFYYVSERYTGTDNKSYMPGYYLSNIIFGKNVNLKNFILSLQLEINNLMDLDYQSIVDRPMPGINYAFTLKIALPGGKRQ